MLPEDNPEEEEGQEEEENIDADYLLRIQQYREHVAALQAIAQAEESFLVTIDNLNHQNRRLEGKINEADAQNNILQLQLKVLNNKMENLETFMTTLNEMKEDNWHEKKEKEAALSTLAKLCKDEPKQQCPKCGYNLNKSHRRSESLDRDLFHDLLPESTLYPTKRRHSDDISNPMMIDLVVAKIMDHLPPPTLLKCRLVNTLWNTEASYRLRERQTFNLNFDNIELITKFNANPSTSECLFTRVKIDIGFIINPFRNYLEEFFQIYGPTMTHFSINCEEEFASRIYTEEFRSIFLGYLQNIQHLEFSLPTKITERQSLYDDPRPRCRFLFPNLTSLVLNQFDNSGGYNVWFTKELLKMGPNLQSLRVETHNKEVMTKIILALGDRESRAICSQLKHLYLDAFVTQQHLEMLTQLDFQLKSLQLSCFTVEVTKEVLEAFLSKHRTTLETLILGDYQKRPSQNTPALTIKLPVMVNLRNLTLVDPCFPDQRNIILSPLHYTVQLPKLRSIVFDHETGKPSGIHLFSDLFNGSSTPCETLKELKITHSLTDILLVAQAAKVFPNLEKLHVANVTDPVLKEIWTYFDFIKELRLELCPANVNVDSVLTGVPEQVCKKIQERNLYSQVEALDVLDIIRTEPSICNFSKLRTLRIEGLPSTLLTAVSGYLAFSQMKSLTSVSIKSDVATISRECRRVLGERLNLTLFELF